jgi:hypothetical protein
MLFSKEHLSGTYNWSLQTDTPVYEGQATRRLFDRNNGDQVLFMINLLLENDQNISIEQGRKIEALIINKLPVDSRSELTVFNWLQKEIMVEA